jgi:Tol biopolymer transport system component
MKLRSIVCGGCVALLAVSGVSGTTSEPRTELVSVDSAGAQGNGNSNLSAISADGRFVAFRSNAPNLVPEDTNGTDDIFVRDRQTGTTERVSVDSSGVQGNAISGFALSSAISADGRYVAFASNASNLAPDDLNGNFPDVFVHDRATRQTELVSVDTNGPGGHGGGLFTVSMSADGRFIAFDSALCGNCLLEVFVRDRTTRQTEKVSVSPTGTQANGASGFPAISADGRFVAFASGATNLVEGDTNGRFDVFVYDRQSRTTELVSVTSDGVQGNVDSGLGGPRGGFPVSVSGDGRLVAFVSSASNLVPGDTNRAADVFVRDRASGTTERVSIGSGGEQASGATGAASISRDGRLVAFDAFGLPEGNTGSEDVFVHNLETHTTELISVKNVDPLGRPSLAPAISADGRFVAFFSSSGTVVEGDTNPGEDVFVRDRGGFADAAPPILTVPAEITVDATSPDGAMVAFVVSAIDDVDGVVAVTCSPESGSIFPVGTTTVACSATDAAGNTGRATFVVTVKPFFARFAAFKAEIEIEVDEIELKAFFRLGAASDGIQPKTEAVTLTVGAFEVTLPPGSFRDDGNGRVRARVQVDGFKFDARIRREDRGFEFRINLPRDQAALLGPTAEVSLTIGNDRGLATAFVEID